MPASGTWTVTRVAFALLCCASFAVRIADLNTPLNASQWTTAHSLITLDIWERGGLAAHSFSPAMTYGREADRHISFIGGLTDAQGRMYYLSYPPLTYLLPYAAFRVAGVATDVLPLQLWNIGTQLVTAFVILKLLELLFGRRSAYPLCGAALYLFLPATLWGHFTIYTPETGVQLPFAATLYATALILHRRSLTVPLAAFFCTSLFCFVSSEWLGVLYGGCVAAYCLWNRATMRHAGVIAFLACATVCAAVMTMLFQYAQIAGWSPLFTLLAGKYAFKSGVPNPFGFDYRFWYADPRSVLNIIRFYLAGFMPLLIMITFLLAAVFTGRKKIPSLNPMESALLLLSGAPAVLHHLLLYGFTVKHEFATLKSAFFLILLAVLLLSRLETLWSAGRRRSHTLIVAGLMTAVLVASATQFTLNFSMNRRTDAFERMGTHIRATSGTGDTLFMDYAFHGGIDPQVLWYAHANIQRVDSREEALQFMRQFERTSGVFYRVDGSRSIFHTERLTYDPLRPEQSVLQGNMREPVNWNRVQ